VFVRRDNARVHGKMLKGQLRERFREHRWPGCLMRAQSRHSKHTCGDRLASPDKTDANANESVREAGGEA